MDRSAWEGVMAHSVEAELRRQVAGLESRNDWLEAQLSYVDMLLLRFGFPEGTKSLVDALHDMRSYNPIAELTRESDDEGLV
ncbi:MAG: hypothetical protein ACOYKZ_01240 [Chlamydiia bacterium]